MEKEIPGSAPLRAPQVDLRINIQERRFKNSNSKNNMKVYRIYMFFMK